MAGEVTFDFTATDAKLDAVARRAEARVGAVSRNVAGQMGSAGGTDALDKQSVALDKVATRHISARHAIGLFAASTGAARGPMMEMFYAVTMFGPAIGGAIAGFLLVKSVIEDITASTRKAIEAEREHQEWLTKMGHVLGSGPGSGLNTQAGRGYEDQAASIRAELDKKQREKASRGFLGEVVDVHSMARLLPSVRESDERQDRVDADKLRVAQQLGKMSLEQMQYAKDLEPLHNKEIAYEESVGYREKGRLSDLQARVGLAKENLALAEKEATLHGGVPGSPRSELQEEIQKELHVKRAALKEATDKERDFTNDTVQDTIKSRQRLNVTLLQMSGRTYEAERETARNALGNIVNNWKSTEADITNAKAEYAAKRADIDYREGEERRKSLEQFRMEVAESGPGGDVTARLDREMKAKADLYQKYVYEGKTDQAEAAVDALEARLTRMGIDAKRELQSSYHPQFVGAADAWKSMATSSLSQTPAEREHIAALRKLTETLQTLLAGGRMKLTAMLGEG